MTSAMSEELTDGLFWLPPEFLTDEDTLSKKPVSGFGSNSGLTSPVSNDTESDEEEYLSGLTRKLHATTLKPESWNFNPTHHSKPTRVMAGSPQSTLCGCKNGSSRGSPNCVSPPWPAAETAAEVVAERKRNQPSLELLYAAAGEVARMKMIEEAAARYYNVNRKPANPALHYQQLQASQFEQLKQQQMLKQQYVQMMLQNRTRSESRNGRLVVPAPASAWPTPQQAHPRPTGTGMRAVFLGNPTAKRESTGTGVFLPRQPGAPTEAPKKRGCSTVLLPDRVVQALDLKLEAIGSESKVQSRCNAGSLASDYEAELMYRKSVMMALQKRNNNRQQQPVTMNEFRLPQEWTY